ncbi:MAG: hypothetical protein DLM62_07055, partial [Pseudonocardiales bacterium]
SAPAELAGLAQQTRPRALITDQDLAALVTQAKMAGVLPLGVLDAEELAGDWAHADSPAPANGAPARGAPASGAAAGDLLGASVSPDDLAVLIPTSGTTGRSKLVMQTHRAYVLAGEGFPYWMELTAQDRLMTSLPLFHINAPAYSVMGSLACGAGLILLPRFSASGFLDAARAAPAEVAAILRPGRNRAHVGVRDDEAGPFLRAARLQDAHQRVEVVAQPGQHFLLGEATEPGRLLAGPLVHAGQAARSGLGPGPGASKASKYPSVVSTR